MELLLFVSFIVTGITGFDPTNHKNWKFLKHDICGESLTMKIVGGEEAPMNGYPWMAQLLKREDNKLKHFCGGALINTKTVISAAHCVAVDTEELIFEIVRFGEHDMDTNPDCTGDFCANPVVDIKPAQIIIHERFNADTFKNDISLIRLEKEVEFSDFIKPICFPFGEMLVKNYTGLVAEVVGWGVYDILTFRISRKLQLIRVTIRNPKVCKKYLPEKLPIGPEQWCAGGVLGKDSCLGDSGGPLMKVGDGPKGPRYYLLGIVSFGTEKCGRGTIPGIYTKLSFYMKWILDNLLKTQTEAIQVM